MQSQTVNKGEMDMFKKYVAFLCAILLMVCGIAACGPTKTPL